MGEFELFLQRITVFANMGVYYRVLFRIFVLCIELLHSFFIRKTEVVDVFNNIHILRTDNLCLVLRFFNSVGCPRNNIILDTSCGTRNNNVNQSNSLYNRLVFLLLRKETKG